MGTPEGVWVVYDWDIGAYPIKCFATELEAHRHRNELGYGHVRHWIFGEDW